MVCLLARFTQGQGSLTLALGLGRWASAVTSGLPRPCGRNQAPSASGPAFTSWETLLPGDAWSAPVACTHALPRDAWSAPAACTHALPCDAWSVPVACTHALPHEVWSAPSVCTTCAPGMEGQAAANPPRGSLRSGKPRGEEWECSRWALCRGGPGDRSLETVCPLGHSRALSWWQPGVGGLGGSPG